jgi:hypothetical protein
MTNKRYVGDVGTVLVVSAGQNISSATAHHLKIIKPDMTEVTWTGDIYNDTYYKYTTVAGDFNLSGIYKVQLYVELTSPAWKGLGETDVFEVFDEYE